MLHSHKGYKDATGRTDVHIIIDLEACEATPSHHSTVLASGVLARSCMAVLVLLRHMRPSSPVIQQEAIAHHVTSPMRILKTPLVEEKDQLADPTSDWRSCS